MRPHRVMSEFKLASGGWDGGERKVKNDIVKAGKGSRFEFKLGGVETGDIQKAEKKVRSRPSQLEQGSPNPGHGPVPVCSLLGTGLHSRR